MKRPSQETLEMLEEKAYQLRRLALEMITHGQVGHPGGSLSEAEILACLYFSELNLDPTNPDWPDRDRFVMSKAHGCPGQYASLALRGFFPVDEIYSYGEIDSRLQSHTDMCKTPGVEMSGGALGQGLSTAVGMAIGLRHFKKWAARVYCLIGDGESNCGQIWEAAMAAAHYKLDNLIAITDYNKVQAKGFVHELMGIEPIADKWRAFGWEVEEVDGHDVLELLEALHRARYVNVRGKPSMIIAHTVKGKGVRWMEFNYRWHTHAPLPEEADIALQEISRRYGRPVEGYCGYGGEVVMRPKSDEIISDKPA